MRIGLVGTGPNVKNRAVFLCFLAAGLTDSLAMSTRADIPATTDASARPKVLRRPAQFSRRAGAPEPAPEPEKLPVTDASFPQRGPGRRAGDTPRQAPAIDPHWSEDSRFGIALIVGVAFVNLVLGLTLPLMHKPQAIRVPATTMLGGEASLPAPTARRGSSGVTIYSGAQERERNRMDLESLPDDYNDFSTSLDDMPAPTARTLGEQ